jgi:hypothetical protein
MKQKNSSLREIKRSEIFGGQNEVESEKDLHAEPKKV